MRILLLGTAAIALSGCSWLGLGGGHKTSHANYSSTSGHYGSHSGATGCETDSCLARWNLEGGVGPAFIAGGTLIDGSKVHGANGGVNDIKYGDAFKTGIRAELGGSYALAPNRKVTATGFYQNNKSNGVQDLGVLNGDAISMEFSDYTSYGAELGLRQYFKPTGPGKGLLKNLRPYVEGKLGGAYVEPVTIQSAFINGVQSAGPLHGAAATDGTWVPSAAGLVGIETPIFKHTTLGLETGIRYTGALSTDGDNFGPAEPLAGFASGSAAWTVPLTVRGRYRF